MIVGGICAIFATEFFFNLYDAAHSGEMRYYEILFYWFGLCLAMFHVKYAFDKKLTERRIKIIDYMYLGVVVAGVLFFAYAYGDQRRVATLEFQKAVELPLSLTLQTVHGDFSRLALLCGGRKIPIAEMICNDSQELDASLTKNLPAKQLTEKWNALSNLLDLLPSALGAQAEKARLVVGDIQTNFKDYLSLKGLDEMLIKNSLLENGPFSGDLPATIQRMLDTGMRTMGQFIVWPFLLLLALALRITKVTIEILGWGQKRATAV